MPKQWVCEELGAPLVLKSVPTALEPPQGCVAVATATCGIDFVATLLLDGRYQNRPPLPFVPGGEVTGTVTAVGADVGRVRVGDLVHVSTIVGGFSEQLVARERDCHVLPSESDLRLLPSMYSYQTSWFALRHRAKLQPGEVLLVLGAAGGVGITAVELGKLMGATVIAAASTQEKLQVHIAYIACSTSVYCRCVQRLEHIIWSIIPLRISRSECES